MNSIDLDKLRDTIKRTQDTRWGLSLVYGLPIAGNFEKVIITIQKAFEKLDQNVFNWYVLSQVHSTLIRGKSSEKPLKLIPEKLLTSCINKIRISAKVTLVFNKIELGSDGFIRIYYKPVQLFDCLTDTDLLEIENKLGLKWRRTNSPWMTIGHLKVQNTDVLSMQKLSAEIDCLLNELNYYINLKINLKEVKLIHYSNVRFLPIEEQRWVSITLHKNEPNSIDIKKLGVTI